MNDQITPGFTPILQVLETRPINNKKTYKVRLSDGYFSYTNCGIATTLADRFEEEGLTSHNGIIKVLQYSCVLQG